MTYTPAQHTQIAQTIFNQMEEIFQKGGWTNAEVDCARMLVAYRFCKMNLNYLENQGGNDWDYIIGLYNNAIKVLGDFGRLYIKTGAIDEDGFRKGSKLAKCSVKLAMGLLEGGNAGDLDAVMRHLQSVQLYSLYRTIAKKAGKEAADEVITPMNNAVQEAVNMELELANRMAS